jgi:putative tricarboxylic transport membrane protein
MSKPRPDMRSIVGAAAFIVVGALAIHYSSEFSPLGQVFPRTIAVLMIVLSAIYIALALLRPGGGVKPEGGSLARRLILAGTMFGWALLIRPVGFLTTSVVCYALILVIANYDRWTPRRLLSYAASGAAVVVGLFAIFAYVLQVPFPQGVLL